MESHPQGIPNPITFDLSTLGFIRPTGMVFLSNFCDWIRHQEGKAYFVNADCANDAVSYLDDSGFFALQTGQKIRPTSSVRSTTQALQKINNAQVHSWLEFTLLPWLAAKLSTTRASLHDFKTCVSEIFNNIQDHTASPIGSIFVQHFPRENQVLISVADWGIGIPTTVRTRLAHLSDEEAIVQATRDGFSAMSRPNNRGAGLALLIDKVVRYNGGGVRIYSLNGIVHFYREGTEIGYQAFSRVGFCPGTTIEIQLRTDTIEAIPDETEDLAWT